MNETTEREKCFVIMPISDQGNYPKGHFTYVYEQIFKPAIEEAGYEPYRVDEDKISTPIINKIFDAIQNCPMAICDLSNRNPNVLYELGLRQAYDKPVVLVQDEKTEKIFDVAGINTIQYSSNRLYENVIEARVAIKEAILSMKEGKGNSIVKIVKAETAHISSEELSKDDKVEIMLSNILSQLQYMRNELKKKERIYIKDAYVNSTEFRTVLKDNILSEDIKDAINSIENFGIDVEWEKIENELVVTVISRLDIHGKQDIVSNILLPLSKDGRIICRQRARKF